MTLREILDWIFRHRPLAPPVPPRVPEVRPPLEPPIGPPVPHSGDEIFYPRDLPRHPETKSPDRPPEAEG